MSDDRDLILFSVVICNNINAKAVDPVIVELVILACNTSPVDGAVSLHVLLNDVEFCIDLRRDQEGIRPLATYEDVIAVERLIIVGVKFLSDGIDFAIRIAAGFVFQSDLSDTLFTSIRTRNQKVIAGAAVQNVRPKSTVENIVTVAAQEHVITVATVKLVVSTETFDSVVGAIAVDHIARLGPGAVNRCFQTVCTKKERRVIVVDRYQRNVSRRVREVIL